MKYLLLLIIFLQISFFQIKTSERIGDPTRQNAFKIYRPTIITKNSKRKSDKMTDSSAKAGGEKKKISLETQDDIDFIRALEEENLEEIGKNYRLLLHRNPRDPRHGSFFQTIFDNPSKDVFIKKLFRFYPTEVIDSLLIINLISTGEKRIRAENLLKEFTGNQSGELSEEQQDHFFTKSIESFFKFKRDAALLSFELEYPNRPKANEFIRLQMLNAIKANHPLKDKLVEKIAQNDKEYLAVLRNHDLYKLCLEKIIPSDQQTTFEKSFRNFSRKWRYTLINKKNNNYLFTDQNYRHRAALLLFYIISPEQFMTNLDSLDKSRQTTAQKEIVKNPATKEILDFIITYHTK